MSIPALRRDLTLLGILRHKRVVVLYFPVYSSDPSAGENFCRTKMMLHHPFTNVQDLADVVNGRIAILITLMKL